MNNEKGKKFVNRKIIAFIMIFIALGWPLIFGLPSTAGTAGPRIVSALLIVLLGLSGLFIYIAQIKAEIIEALKKQGNSD